MEIRPLSDDFAVSPQITPADVPAIRKAGFTTVVCNRPDSEVPGDQASQAIREAVEAEGMRFVFNEFVPSVGPTEDAVEAQGRAVSESEGPVLAYCASGNRSSILWALALAGKRPTDELIAAGTKYGYQTANFRSMIEARAKQRA